MFSPVAWNPAAVRIRVVMPPHFKNRGYTIIEMLVAMTIGLLLISTVAGTFVWTSRNFRFDESNSRMQENARFALDTLTKDLLMSGFLHDLVTADSLDVSQVVGKMSDDCGPSGAAWTINLSTLVEVNAVKKAGEINSAYNCIDNSGLYTHEIEGNNVTDVFAIKRVKKTQGSEVTGKMYLQTAVDGRAQMLLYGHPDNDGNPAFAASDYWEYIVNIYYINDDNDDEIPILYRKSLQGINDGVTNTLAIATESGGIAEGIEHIHIMWGADSAVTDGLSSTEADGHPNYFVSNPTATELPGLVAAKLYVLVRGMNFDSTYKDDKQYALGDLTLPDTGTFNDNYRRKVFSTTLKLRNRIIQNVINDLVKS